MKIVITIAIIAALGVGAYKVWEYWDQTEKQKITAAQNAAGNINPQTLPGFPTQLETQLQEAQSKGPEAFKEFIDNVKKSPLVKDPRLAWIELDYVIMLSRTDPVGAKRYFAKIKQRIEPNSPVYPRIKSLEKTFE